MASGALWVVSNQLRKASNFDTTILRSLEID